MIPFALALLQAGDPYARLAPAIPVDEWKSVEAFVAGGPVPPFIRFGSTRLAVEKAVAQRWEAVLTGLRQASELAYSPGGVESSQVLVLAKLVAFSARSRFAEGDRHGAVSLLLDGLTMARRTRSAEAQAVVLRSFAENLSYLPLAECNRVRTAVDGYGTTDTGLRLLRAHMRIEAYRWQWLKMPSSLKEAMPLAETVDSASGRPFRYEQTAGGYVIKTEPGKDGVAMSLAGPIAHDSEGS